MPVNPKRRTTARPAGTVAGAARTAGAKRVAGATRVADTVRTAKTKQQLEEEVKQNSKLIATLQTEKLTFSSRNTVLEARVKELEKTNLELDESVRKLKIARPTVPSTRLISSFRDALDDMRAPLASGMGGVNYLVSEIQVNLKANVSYDGGKVQFQLPKPDDVIPSENLSTIDFVIKATPTTEVDTSGYAEVPNLVGLAKEMGERLIVSKGFVPGEIEYEDTAGIEPGIVISQMPSPFSVAPPGGPIDLTISKHPGVSVPGFLGLSLDEAVGVAESSELAIGDVSHTVSESEEGTVISQGVKAGETVPPGTAIDLVIAEAKRRETEGGAETDTAKTAEPRVRRLVNIGEYNSDKLDDAGIKTIRDLASASTSKIRKITGVSDSVAKEWKLEAEIHNEAMGDYGAYILVKTGAVKSVDDLMRADPSKLYGVVKRAIAGRKIAVPPGFKLNKRDVEGWIEGANKK